MNLPIAFTLVTPTGDRPEAFALCERWMARQTIAFCEWIVLDDGEVPTVCTMGQTYVRCPEYRGRGSLVSKILHALPMVQSEAMAIIEDDDYYFADYLERQSDRMADGLEVVGEGRALYYHIGLRWYYEHGNLRHASLCQTALRRDAFELLRLACIPEDPFIDTRLWSVAGARGHVFDPEGHRTLVGIKGMPGRTGYGAGWRAMPRGARIDGDGSHLLLTIGRDAEHYFPFFHHHERTPART